jgi:hypothetical protein
MDLRLKERNLFEPMNLGKKISSNLYRRRLG